MCELCHSFPCIDGCPNCKEPEPVAICPKCNCPIHEGEEVAEINCDLYHVECLEEMSTKELLAMFDVYTERAAS